MSKYLTIKKEINQSIAEFNKFVASDYQVAFLNESEFDNPKYYGNLVKNSWDDLRWVNPDKGGVYFIFGYDSVTKELGVYVGKASLSSKIGKRFYDHLQKHRNEENYLMNDGNGNCFILEMLTSISLEDKNTIFLSPALEEFLISNLGEKIKLINVTGNYNN